MAQVTPRNLDKVGVLEGGAQGEFLIPTSTFKGKITTAQFNNMKDLTIKDLYHIIGFRVGSNPGKVSDRSKALTLDDIHALGRVFALHTAMTYPDMVMSCCCCI